MNPKHSHLDWAHPLVRDWFLSKLGEPTEPQILGWPPILAGRATLISAPTGSGKTLASFLVCINKLIQKAVAGTLENQTEILYISPLKALSNDIHKNLEEPLAEIKKLAEERGIQMQKIEVAVRTGDTLVKERQQMLKKPPHILVSTPESLYILLTSEKSREILKNIKTVIVDEIHALVNNKRGAHLALSLERLEAITYNKLLRIGLSATQKPIEWVAEFLTGANRPLPVIVDKGHARKLELTVEVPNSELGPVASNEMWDEIYDKIAELAQQNRSTLVFVNTRRLSERVAHHLSERIGEELVTSHHGSLSRKLRLSAENRLKKGELKVLVATASLELGIDIGTVDLVCQIGSPRGINVALQRVGRAGHWYGAISKGIFFTTTRDELLECAALVYAIRAGKLDSLIFPEEPLDILAQQIVAICATDDWEEKALFQLITHALPYKNLSLETFNDIINMLSEGMAGSRGRYGAYLFRDQVNGIVKSRRGSRLTAITSGGAIPDNGLFLMVAEPDNAMVGTLDEDFAVESNRGDVILLGTTSWIVKRVESAASRVLVENANGAPPSVPFWRGEAPGRSDELSKNVAILREKLHEMLPVTKPFIVELDKQPNVGKTIQWLKETCSVDQSGAEQLIEYILQGRAVLGAVPTQDTIIAERFFDEAGGMQLIIHSPFGMRINKAWGLSLRKKFCRSFNFELQASATDNGLNISLAEQHSFPLQDVFQFLHPNTVKENLVQAILQSPLFKTRWRWTATRALALIRFRRGKKVPPNIQRMLSDDLLAAVFPDAAACQDNLGGKDIELPNHPLINETIKDALNDALDIEGFLILIEKIVNNEIKTLAIDTPVPSVFSHEILNANPYAFLDDAPLEERRARAVELRRMLPQSVLEEIGKLDPDAILEVQQQAWPDIRSSDELHDLLQTLIVLPEKFNLSHHQKMDPLWILFFNELKANNRVGTVSINDPLFWYAAEKRKTVQAIYPEADFSHLKILKVFEPNPPTRNDALLTLLRGWVQHLGPTTAFELKNILLLNEDEITQLLIQLEGTGLILRGKFRSEIIKSDIEKPGIEYIEWCERRLLARIHKLTLGKLRKEIASVSAAQFMQWLLKWQHVAPGTQLRGEEGLFEIIKQLQGFEIPANAWESQIFAKRLKPYERENLDRLCLTGRIGWGRFSKHSLVEDNIKDVTPKSVKPSSIAPITFFIRGETNWINRDEDFSLEENLAGLSSVAKSIYEFLKQKGASFFADIAHHVKRLESEIETGLWELVAVGAITADSFDNLRSLIDANRRLNKRGRRGRTRFSTGRWSLLQPPEPLESNEKNEAICWMLLKRYGVVFRDLLAREKNLPRWRDLLIILRRLEDRGEIRGGRFVSGFQGEQFALPYAVESLRANRHETETGNANVKADSNTNEQVITVSSADPLNLVGIILPGAKISSLSRQKIILRNGIADI